VFFWIIPNLTPSLKSGIVMKEYFRQLTTALNIANLADFTGNQDV